MLAFLSFGQSLTADRMFCKGIEDVQHRATKPVPSMKDEEYPDRLAALKLPSL